MGKMEYAKIEEAVAKKGGKLLYRIHYALTGVDEILVHIDGKNILTTVTEFLK